MSKSVKDFGAQGDSFSDDYPAFQNALDDKEMEITVPKGIYLVTETLKIPSDKTLLFEEGAMVVLCGKTPRKRGDFLLTNKDIEKGNENITVIGGIFDGNVYHKNHRRPKDILDENGYSGILLNFCNVKNLTLKNLTLQNPVAYFTRFCKIDGFLLENIVLQSDKFNPNQDGIHLAGEVRNGAIRNIRAESYGQTNDDFLAINADDAPNRIEVLDACCGNIENIVVEDIFCESCHSAVRLLSFRSDIRNITFKNLRMGFRRFAVNGYGGRECRATLFDDKDYPRGVGNIENVSFVDCVFWHTEEYPFLWKGSGGNRLRPSVLLGEACDKVKFENVAFVEAPRLYASPVIRKVREMLKRKREKIPYYHFRMEKTPSQKIIADGKTYFLSTKEDTVTIKDFTSLTIEKQ